MNIRRIECFLMVVDTGTVTAAAGQLFIAQPALSRQLQTLESELGFKLFDHNRNRLQLTPAGREFVPMARLLLSNARLVQAGAKNIATGHIKRLHLAATPATIRGLVAPFLATLPPSAPLILTHEAEHFHIHDQLRSGIDLVISPAPCGEEFASQLLGMIPIKAYVPQSHPWAQAGRTAINLEELLTQPLILPSTHSVSRVELDLAVARAGLQYSSVEECDEAHTIQALAVSGHGVGIVTDRPRYGAYGLHIQISERDVLGVTLHAAWDRQHYGTGTLETLAEQVRTYLATARQLPLSELGE
ncbi:DNA-binding transcriptional regulator, LysR family [Pseudomonas linyingensis]|uniref:DNA-binding transcriptional regulator, LysR family n=1 Tax=Pseudomonas linyingensis TaxID=915471 RepID=A0A1H6ZZD5_9PSED|nr:LysR family transcriptional regulator [Pseudomonas linyingensis]SEJ58803.1 DNA-binding transcriptional regulator, LysR family [Pseudomonas linyingensis]